MSLIKTYHTIHFTLPRLSRPEEEEEPGSFCRRRVAGGGLTSRVFLSAWPPHLSIFWNVQSYLTFRTLFPMG